MKDEPRIGHVTPADRNIFLDLGFEPEEAAKLKAESDRQIVHRDAEKETSQAEPIPR